MRFSTVWLAAAVALFAGTAMADPPGADWLTKPQVVKQLGTQGLTHVTGLEADDGHWEGEALRDGKIVEFHADPRTGKLMSVKAKDKH